MSSTFTGFSEEDLKRIKSNETPRSNVEINTPNVRKLDRLGVKPKRPGNQYKLALQKQSSDDAIDNIDFQKCKLSIKTPTPNKPSHENSLEGGKENEADKCSIDLNENVTTEKNSIDFNKNETEDKSAVDLYESVSEVEMKNEDIYSANRTMEANDLNLSMRRFSSDSTPDIVRGVNNYSEQELAAHRVKLEGLQLKQKLMEEQNKKRKEMLSKALADRTKQTEEEVMRLEKIKKELQVLDGQFSQDVAVLRKRIDQACIGYAEAEKHYLRVEKEFLQAKISLQKEREKKELLTEHLCTLITHNETRKAQKLETLMLELASDKKREIDEVTKSVNDEEPVIVDGVDQRTGKMVELPIES